MFRHTFGQQLKALADGDSPVATER
jgi:hypothetical protein